MPNLKKNIRENLLLQKRNLPADLISSLSREIIHKVLLQPKVMNAQNFFVYYSLADEVSTQDLISHLIQNKKNVAIPYIENNGKMTAKIIKSHDLTVKGKFGIYQPGPGCKEMPMDEIDIIIVPGVSFDARKNRLGIGTGYYDRFLSKSSGFSIGLAFDFQITENLPVEKHDRPVDMVISEKRVID